MFRKKYGLPLYPEIVRLNEFTNLDEYFMQQTIAEAVALLRDKEVSSTDNRSVARTLVNLDRSIYAELHCFSECFVRCFNVC